MIELHRLNKVPFLLNHRLIESVEALPDTVITLNTEKKFIVRETPEQVTERIIAFERKIYAQKPDWTVDR